MEKHELAQLVASYIVSESEHLRKDACQVKKGMILVTLATHDVVIFLPSGLELSECCNG